MLDIIVPNRELISERFPIASFSVRVPQARFFEVACATDPRLFHTDHATHRSPANFYSSRAGGLLVAQTGANTFILPGDQLRRFAGSRRLYYALGTYGGRNGEQPRFSIGPDGLDRVPSIGIAADFTGRSLDRGRVGVRTPVSAAYGGPQGRVLRWGGDAVLEAERARQRRSGGARARIGQPQPLPDYDDGFDPGLWSRAASAFADDADMYADDDLVGQDQDLDLGREYDDDDDDHDRDQAIAQSHGRFARRGGQRFRGADAAVEPRMDAPMQEPVLEYEDGAAYYAAVPEAGLGGMSPPVSGIIEDSSPPHTETGGDPDDADVDDDEYEDGAQLRAEQPEAATPVVAGRGLVRRLFGQPRGSAGAASTARSPTHRALAYGNPDGGVPVRSRPRARRATRGRHPGYSEDGSEESLPVGAAARPLSNDVTAPDPAELTIPQKIAILRIVARAESGEAEYSAIYEDGEFNDPRHPFHGRIHVGLSWGLLLFTQRGGALGKVLRLAKARETALRAADPSTAELPAEHHFERLFGDAWQELLDVTDPDRAASPEDMLRPVAGARLWEAPWPAKFVAAGAVGYVQAAQNQVAVDDYFDAIVPVARALGIDTARGLAMLVDRVVHMGVGGGLSFLMQVLGPIRTEADRERALEALGFGGRLADFRRSRGLDTNGESGSQWDALTHAALAEALRDLGAASPVALPDRDASLLALCEAARGSDFEERVRALFENTGDFDDATSFRLG
jgi:hypothetical protein